MNRTTFTLLVVATFAVAACGPSGPSGTASSAPSAAPSAPASSTGSAPPSSAGEAGQTDTEWGRIWDTLPVGFPPIPGARPTDEAATGPASATFVIAGDVSRLVAAALVNQLAGEGFPTELGAPLESGAYVLEATGPTAGCKLQVTVEPMGGETLVTILYGAACPHE